MEMIPPELRQAALDARARLADFANQTAISGAVSHGVQGTQTAMAGAAKEAVFADALLGAMRARFEEIRTAAK